MGDQVYAYRSSQYSSAACYDGDWKGNYYAGVDDKLCRTVICDRDGRQQTVYGCPPDYPVSDRRFSSPPPAAHQYGRPYWGPSQVPVPNDDRRHRRPQEVEEFLTGVQFEASRANPRYGDYRRGNGYGGYSHSSDEYTDGDEDDDYDYDDDDDERDHRVRMYPRPMSPVVSRPNGGGRVVPVIAHGVGKLSLPMNSIDEAVDYLKLGKSTNNFNTSTVETTARPYGEAERPYGTKYGATNNTFGVNKYSTYGTNKYDQQSGYGTTANPNSNLEIPRSYGTNYHQTNNNNNPEPVLKPFGSLGYGKTNNLSTTTTTTTTVIDCYEAARKYNGKVIRT